MTVAVPVRGNGVWTRDWDRFFFPIITGLDILWLTYHNMRAGRGLGWHIYDYYLGIWTGDCCLNRAGDGLGVAITYVW